MMIQVYPTTMWLAACVLALAGGCRKADVAGAPPAVRQSETRRLMGVPWTITVFAATPLAGREAVAAAFAEVQRQEGILSDYDPESELSRLSAAAPTASPVPVGDDLWRVLSAAVEWRDRSKGAFDPTVGPLTTTVLIAGDDSDAKSTLAAIVTSGGLKAIDAGSLKRARELEAVGFLQLTLAANEKVSWTGGFGVIA